jgi:hypothetical protein
MILAHSIQILGDADGLMGGIATYVYLIAFPGFFFAFGYVSNIAYLSKDYTYSRPRMLKTAYRIAIAYYISNFLSVLILSEAVLGIRDVINILLLWHIAQYADFLIAFSLVVLGCLIFFNFFRAMTPAQALILSIASLLTTFIPPDPLPINQLGLFIGTAKQYTFPVLPYLLYFILGLMFARYNIGYDRKILFASYIGSASLIAYTYFTGKTPTHFPPHFFWIIGAGVFVYIYYLVSRPLSRLTWTKFLSDIGENTLLYLLISNILLFAFHGVSRGPLHPVNILLMVVGILYITNFIKSISVNKTPLPASKIT